MKTKATIIKRGDIREGLTLPIYSNDGDDFTLVDNGSLVKYHFLDILEGEETVEDLIKKPNHYTKFAIQPKTYIMANNMEFWRGNIVKYATRAGSKVYAGKDAGLSEITDLQKVCENAQFRINQLLGKEV